MSLRPSDPVRIGRYRLTARLGSGGMGVVYLGVAPDGGLVAVKVLRPELADDPEFRRRFGREVSVLMRVRGVCTVRVIEADTDSQLPFMVTEYVDGPSLAEYIDQWGSLNAEMLYGLATGLAEALTVIHAAGIVHRDLKPSNVILAQDGPKVIDFGIAQTLDATSVTKTGMMVGSAGFMAPEQVTGRPGPAADIFVWGVTIGYAAAGHSPFGTGDTNAVLYRVLYSDPDLSAVPDSLKPLVGTALSKDPQNRPAAHELLDRLTSMPGPARPAPVAERMYDAPTQTVLARTWQDTGARPSRRSAPQPQVPEPSRPSANGSLLLDRASPVSQVAPRRVSRRTTISASAVAIVVAAAAVLVVFLHPGHTPKRLAGNQGTLVPTASLPVYAGQQQRGVFQTISRIVSWGNTMVTTGSQISDGVARQQFFASSDGGVSWHLAPVQLPGGGQPPVGDVATRIAGGSAGWMAEGPQSIWTSPNGAAWTLAATHGITPQEPGDSVNAVINTADGFLAVGGGKSSDGNQAVIWLSHDGVTWHRMTAAQLGLTTASGQAPSSISFATTRGNDTLISDQGSVWLSTDGGSAWTPVTVPADHGAKDNISGVSFDGSGLIVVRPGQTASGASDGVAYFSPNGLSWQYAATIDPAGGWSPGVVKGSNDGFVVTGATAQKQYVAYTSTGTGTTWRPTGALGGTSSAQSLVPTVGAGGTVIAVGSAEGTTISQQAVFLRAYPSGKVTPVSLGGISGGVIPEVAVKSTAVAGGEQIAVGSADGYPAIWRKASNGSWALVSSLSLLSGTTSLTQLTSVTHGSAGWLAVGFPGPDVFTSADGISWHPASGSIAQDLGSVLSISAAAGSAGYVIAAAQAKPGGGCTGDVWWSSNLTSWSKAYDVNLAPGSFVVLSVAAGPHGFVSVGSRDGMPVVWTTADGRAWTTRELPVASDLSAGQVYKIAINGNHVVALGTQTTKAGTVPLAELSNDGGTSWQQRAFVSAGPGTLVTALTAVTGGFTAAGQFGATGQAGAAVWTSADGTSWTQSPVSGLTGGGNHTVTTLAPAGTSVTGIDSILTQQGQSYVTLSLPGR
jgi:serine/threonine protein kinase